MKTFGQIKPGKPSPETMLADLQTLEKNYNILLSAEQELKQVQGENSKKTKLEKYLRERKLANLVTGGLFTSYLLLSIILDILFSPNVEYFFGTLLSYLIFGWLIIELFRHRPNSRMWATMISVIPLVFSIFSQFSEPNIGNLLFSLSFTVSILLILVGKPDRPKLYMGTILFLLTNMFPMLLSILFFFFPW